MTGISIYRFKKAMAHYKANYRRIIAFEPNIRKASEIKKNHQDVTLFCSGVWNEDAFLSFSGEGSSFSAVEHTKSDCMESSVNLPVKAIDNCVECKDATFIKMDVEGAELPALIGAESLIKRNKPKLAICIYHSEEDMLRIAEYLHNLIPEYKLYVRHHTRFLLNETVLYATI